MVKFWLCEIFSTIVGVQALLVGAGMLMSESRFTNMCGFIIFDFASLLVLLSLARWYHIFAEFMGFRERD